MSSQLDLRLPLPRVSRPPDRVVPAAPRCGSRLEELRSRGLRIRAISELTGVSVGALQHLWQRDCRRVALTTKQRLDAMAR